MVDDKHRRQWLAMLAKLVAPMDAANATKALCDMLPMLAGFDEAVFTTQSLEHVAGAVKRTPSYGELRLHLGNWWRDNRSAAARLASEWTALPSPPKRAGPTPEECEAVADVVAAFKSSTAIAKSHAVAVEHERPLPKHLTDLQLLAVHSELAAKGNTGSQARVEQLRRRLGIKVDVEAPAVVEETEHA
jgi:hypothetical protein